MSVEFQIRMIPLHEQVPSTPSSRPGRFARFAVPPRRPDLLKRQRLLDILYENSHRKLNLIVAAPGYGKTTLLVDYANDTEHEAAWCRLDETDRDLAAFVGHLALALQYCFPTLTSVLPALAAQPGAEPATLAAALNREIEEGVNDYFTLILDDFHLLADTPAILSFVDSLLANMPEQAHLLIAGRAIPPLHLVSLAARDQVAGLSEEDLRFTSVEVRELLQLRHQVDVPEQTAEKLVGDTEGWITGILLTTHLMWQGLLAGLRQARQADRPVYDYLATEVLDQQPEPLRQFLLESAVLPEMEPAVCDAVLDRTDSATWLQQAEARRLFVSVVGDEFRVYHYHHLFREFLAARLATQNPERLKFLQIRAADWYAAHDMAEFAVTFYVAGSEFNRAAQVAEVHAAQLFTAGRYSVLQRWAEQLGEAAAIAPALYLNLAKADLDLGELTRAEDELALAAAGFERHGNAVGILETDLQRGLLLYRQGHPEDALALTLAAAPRARALGQKMLLALALRYCGRCQLALKQLEAAEASLREADAILRGLRHTFDRALVLDDLAVVLRVRGQTAQVARLQQDALALWRELAVPGPLAIALNNVGWDQHMLGQYEAALSTYREALEWAKRAGNARAETFVLASQADVFADLGEHDQAADLYRVALTKAETARDESLTIYLAQAMARLDRWRGNFPGAVEWLRRAKLIAKSRQLESALANLERLRGMILVEMGQITEGRRVLIQVCAELEQTGALVDLAQTLLFRACAEFRAGDLEIAGASLDWALTLAEHVGYDQMLVSEVAAVRDVLEALRHWPEIGLRVTGLLNRAQGLNTVRARLRGAPSAEFTWVGPAPRRSAAIEVRVLGNSRVLKDGVEVTRADWYSPRTRELFLFLVDRAPISRDQVLEVFWPDKPHFRAVNNLYQMLFRMRRALRAEIVTLSDQVCQLAVGLDLDYDVSRFQVEARAALALAKSDLRRLSALESALTLYTGDFLTDLPADWALERRQALTDLHVEVLVAYAEELMALTRYLPARDTLAKAISLEPYRDNLHQFMLICLSKLGRQHEIVTHYSRYRESLRSELGLDPPPEIRALYAQLIG